MDIHSSQLSRNYDCFVLSYLDNLKNDFAKRAFVFLVSCAVNMLRGEAFSQSRPQPLKPLLSLKVILDRKIFKKIESQYVSDPYL